MRNNKGTCLIAKRTVTAYEDVNKGLVPELGTVQQFFVYEDKTASTMLFNYYYFLWPLVC